MRAQRSVHVLSALAVLACAVAACGGASTQDGTKASVSTTTLPVVTGVTGSAAGGGYAALGPVERVSVLPVAPGRVAPRLLADGTMRPGALRIAFRQFGSGPDLVLVTGEHGSLTAWDPQVLLELGAHYRVTVFDLPGIGYSEPSPRVETVSSLADLTAGLIWSLGLSQPTVVGWGFGGEVAMSLAERHPGLVWRLVLADATAGGPRFYRPAAAVSRLLASPSTTQQEIAQLFFPADEGTARLNWLSDVGQISPDDVTASAIVAQAALIARMSPRQRRRPRARADQDPDAHPRRIGRCGRARRQRPRTGAADRSLPARHLLRCRLRQHLPVRLGLRRPAHHVHGSLSGTAHCHIRPDSARRPTEPTISLRS